MRYLKHADKSSAQDVRCFQHQNGTCVSICVALSYTSLVAQTVKRLSTMQETWVRSLDWEDPLEKKEMAIHSSTIAWKTPWT